MPKVSIIMPYFNAALYIYETVDAIIAQSYKDWELIIVDDCSSSPDTEAVLNNIGTLDGRIRILRTKVNCGAGAARNLGIKEAKGRYIAFCDADDWWYPSKLDEQLNWMEVNGYEFTCTWYEDTNERLEPYYTMKQRPKQNFHQLLSGCNIGTPGVIYDTMHIGKKYMPDLRRAEDWGLWLILLKDLDYVYSYQKPLWKYRHVSGSETSNKFKQLLAVITMYHVVLNFPIWKAWLFCFFVFLPNNIFKKLLKRL